MIGQRTAVYQKRLTLISFFESYLLAYAPYAINVADFFRGKDGHLCSTEEFEKALRGSRVKNSSLVTVKINYICNFIDWVIENYFSQKDDSGDFQPIVSNPLSKRNPKDGRYKDQTFGWLLTTHGQGWRQWQKLASEWMIGQRKVIDGKRTALISFFEIYLLAYAPYAINVADFFRGKDGHLCSMEEFEKALRESGIKSLTKISYSIILTCDFIDWLIENHFSKEVENGDFQPLVSNPLTGRKRKNDGRFRDLTFSWLLTTHGQEWRQWQKLAAEWMSEQKQGVEKKRSSLVSFFETYLQAHAPYAKNVEDFFRGKNGHLCSTGEFVKVLNMSGVRKDYTRQFRVNCTFDFINWVIDRYYSEQVNNGNFQPIVSNPFSAAKVYDGRSKDLTFSWLLTTHGQEWKQWQELAAEWMAMHDKGVGARREALTAFFESYLKVHAPYAINVADFFRGQKGHRCSTEEFKKALKESGVKGRVALAKRPNYTCEFIDWVIENYFSEKNDKGVLQPLVTNPLSRAKFESFNIETVHTPLPFRYIQELRQILCPLPNKHELDSIRQDLKSDEFLLPPWHYRNFKDWAWAQKQIGDTGGAIRRDWFEVHPAQIDKSDPDCVWRKVELFRGGSKKVTVHQIWSPVKAVLIFTWLSP